jgi:hypothetical protein
MYYQKGGGMITACRECLFKYKALFRLMAKAIVAGILAILLLHFFVPEAEHPKMLSTIGLLLDIFGVTWIAYDLFPFAGEREYLDDKRSGIETPEYTDFKRSHAAIGLSAIVIGFLFQILAYWISDILDIVGVTHA